MSHPVSETDQCDIEASLQGDEQAFARLVRRYESTISAQMWRFTRDPRALDELVQDVFVETYLSLSRFKGRAPFLHWLRRIATRTGYRYWTREARNRKRREILEARKSEWVAPPADAGPAEAAEWLHRLLERLPVKDRLVLTLYYFEECDSTEIALRMGWSATLVRVRAHRALKKLRRLLDAASDGRPFHD